MKTLTKVEAIIQPDKLEAVKAALIDLDLGGMTISDVRGHGRQEGPKAVFRGHEYTIDFLPSIKVELVLADEQVDGAIDAIVANAGTGGLGAGKIFLSRIDDIIRIRNQQRGVAAL